MHHMYYNNGILRWLISIMHMALPILVIFFIFSLFNRVREDKNRNLSADNPVDLLKERYAKGEISREEFMRIKEDIRG